MLQEVIYDRILKIFREALLEHLEGTCVAIKTKIISKRETATINQTPAANNTANTIPPSPLSPKVRRQHQHPRRQINPSSVSSSGAASYAKSQSTTNVIIENKKKKDPITNYEKLSKEILEIIREIMRTRIVLSLVDGAKAEFRSMKEKCIQAIEHQHKK